MKRNEYDTMQKRLDTATPLVQDMTRLENAIVSLKNGEHGPLKIGYCCPNYFCSYEDVNESDIREFLVGRLWAKLTSIEHQFAAI
jgi:hypothetical protein